MIGVHIQLGPSRQSIELRQCSSNCGTREVFGKRDFKKSFVDFFHKFKVEVMVQKKVVYLSTF